MVHDFISIIINQDIVQYGMEHESLAVVRYENVPKSRVPLEAYFQSRPNITGPTSN